MRRTRDKAFTLIELLVVIGIIAVIAGIIFPVFFWAREKARQITCLSNLRQLGMADLMYAQDYGDYFPPFANTSPGRDCLSTSDSSYRPGRCAPGLLHEALMPYIRNNRIWFCPDDPVAGQNVNRWLVNHQFSSYRFDGSFFSYEANLSVMGLVAIHPGHPNILDIIIPPSRCLLINDANTACCGPSDPPGDDHFGGWNAVYVDGHAKWNPPDK